MNHRSGNHSGRTPQSCWPSAGLFKKTLLVCLLASTHSLTPALAQGQTPAPGIEQPTAPASVQTPADAAPNKSGSSSQSTASTDKTSPGVLKAQSDESYFIQTGLGLAFVIALLFGLLWVMKRAGLNPAQAGSQFYKVLAVTSLGPREKIALIEVGDQWLMVGMTQHSINTLHTMPKGSLAFNPERNATLTFAKLLDRMKKTDAKTDAETASKP